MIIKRILFLAFLTIVNSFGVFGTDALPEASAGGEQCDYTKEQLFCKDKKPITHRTSEDLKVLEALNRHSQIGEVDRNKLFVKVEIQIQREDGSIENKFVPLGFFMSGWQDYSTKKKIEIVSKAHKKFSSESPDSPIFSEPKSVKDTFAKSLDLVLKREFSHNSIFFAVPVLNLDGITYPPYTLSGFYEYPDHLSWKLHFMNLLSILSCEPGKFDFSDIRRKVPDSNIQPFIEDCYVEAQKKYKGQIDSFQSEIKPIDSSSLSMDDYMKQWTELSKYECFSSSGFYKSFGCSEQAFLSFLGQREFSLDVGGKIAEICSSDGTINEINLHLTSTYNMCCYCNFTFDMMLKKGYLQAVLKNLFDDTYLYSKPAEAVTQKSDKQKKQSKGENAVDSSSPKSKEESTPQTKTIKIDDSMEHKIFFTYLKKINRGESK